MTLDTPRQPFGHAMLAEFPLEAGGVYLNHGTVGVTPLAVTTSLRTSSGLPLRRHCASAECSESTGRSWPGLARDVIRAAIFLLLLCVPFSFCMERLIIGTPNVYKQIAGICAIA